MSRENTSQEKWTAVDRYINDLFVPDDTALAAALEASTAAGLPPISVTPNQGKLLQFLAQISGARTILEIGTLGAYSTLWLARALPPGGRLITLEALPKHAAVARANIARAGLDTMVELRLGPALETLPQLASEFPGQKDHGPFDLVFIDADKPSYPEYFSWAIQLTHPGSLIVADNLVRDGELINANSSDPAVQGVRRFCEAVAAEPRVTTTAIQTVGSKGYDGFSVSLVTA